MASIDVLASKRISRGTARERTFDSLDLIVGYGFDFKVRKIVTTNPETAMFGIRPGMPLQQGRHMLLESGFSEHSAPSTYSYKGYALKLLDDGKGTIFGLSLEIIDG